MSTCRSNFVDHAYSTSEQYADLMNTLGSLAMSRKLRRQKRKLAWLSVAIELCRRKRPGIRCNIVEKLHLVAPGPSKNSSLGSCVKIDFETSAHRNTPVLAPLLDGVSGCYSLNGICPSPHRHMERFQTILWRVLMLHTKSLYIGICPPMHQFLEVILLLPTRLRFPTRVTAL